MEPEIIKTDDPNIIIERTIIDKEINLDDINFQIKSIIDQINNLNIKINIIKNTNIDNLKDILSKQLGDFEAEKVGLEYRLEQLNNTILSTK